jgi:cytochrome b involved in lipid metabolism
VNYLPPRAHTTQVAREASQSEEDIENSQALSVMDNKRQIAKAVVQYIAVHKHERKKDILCLINERVFTMG